jgi:hypothetical protein
MRILGAHYAQACLEGVIAIVWGKVPPFLGYILNFFFVQNRLATYQIVLP